MTPSILKPQIETTPERAVAIRAIFRERDHQDEKWDISKENIYSVGEWLLVMQAELNEALEAWVKNKGDSAALEEIVQVAAAAFACLEQHGTEQAELFDRAAS